MALTGLVPDLDTPYVTFQEWLQAKTFLREKEQMEARKRELEAQVETMSHIFP